LDTATDDFYNETSYGDTKINKTDEEIEQEIEQQKETLESWKKDKKDLSKMYKDGKPLEKIYGWEVNWEKLYYKVDETVPDEELDDDENWTRQLREFLNNKANWSDDRIWQTLIEICDEKVRESTEEIDSLKKQKEKNRLKLQVIKKLGSIPSKDELDRLLRYEGAIERQLYKAMNQLERLQRMRAGDNVPAPVEVDVNTSENV
jgi:DNA primase